jgi:hypothetical protein
MAFETVNLHRFITMAGHTKTVIARNHAIIFRAGMALNTVFQAVFFVAYAFTHRLIALMLEQVHMIFAHPLRFFHTLPSLADIDSRRTRSGSPDRSDA